jgi:hypothetical protein
MLGTRWRGEGPALANINDTCVCSWPRPGRDALAQLAVQTIHSFIQHLSPQRMARPSSIRRRIAHAKLVRTSKLGGASSFVLLFLFSVRSCVLAFMFISYHSHLFIERTAFIHLHARMHFSPSRIQTGVFVLDRRLDKNHAYAPPGAAPKRIPDSRFFRTLLTCVCCCDVLGTFTAPAWSADADWHVAQISALG